MAYRGIEAKIPLGELGLLTDIAPDKIPPPALIYSNNICYYNGTIQKAPGGLKWNASALDSGVVAVFDFWPNGVTQRMIAATSGGYVYKGRDRVFATTLASGLGNLTPNSMFVEGGIEEAGNDKKLFLFTGESLPQVLTGDEDTMSAVSQPSTDWTVGNFPRFGVIHRNRLFAFAGQMAYGSASDNHENFVSSTIIDGIGRGEGGDLRGGFVFKGRLHAFKDGGYVYALIDDDTDDDNWYWTKVASNFGLAAPNAIAEVLDDMVAGNTTGTLTSYGATQALGNIEAADIIQQAQFENFLRGTTSKVGVPFQHIKYYSEKKLLLITYRSAYYTYNDMLLVLDFGRQGTVRPSYWIKGSPQCLGLYKDINEVYRPMYGNKDGFVILADQEDRLEATVAYRGDFQIPHLDFSHLDPKLSTVEKHFDFLAVHYVPEASANLSCDYYIDGRFVETVTFPMVQYTKPVLGTLTLSTDRLAQANTETAIRRIQGTGRTFSARFYNSGSNESFQVAALTVGFRGGTEKAQKGS